MARWYRQAAVIPYRVHERGLEIALVTTSGGKRWVVPKGSLDDGEQAHDAAIRETEEEAGLIGELNRRPLGRYRYTKQSERYQVDVYVMRVPEVLDYWREARYRSRRWMAVEDALARLHPDLHGFVHQTARLVRSRYGRPRSGNGRPRRGESRQ